MCILFSSSCRSSEHIQDYSRLREQKRAVQKIRRADPGENNDTDIIDSGELYLDGFVEDTVINGKTYKVFQELYYSVESILYKSYYFRQEGDRVYRYYDDIGEEIVVYDFGLSRGDIITKKGQIRLRVADVGKACDYLGYAGTGGRERRMIKLEGADDMSTQDIWIEGLGSVYTGLLDKEDYSAEETFVEYMYSRNHITEEEEEKVVFNLSKDHIKTVGGMGEKLNDYDWLELEEFSDGQRHFLMEFNDDTLHVRGFAELFKPDFMARAWITDNTVNLGIDDIADFRYNQAINGKTFKFDIKIPGFSQGVYTVSYNARSFSDRQTVVCGGQTVRADVNQDNAVDISDIVAVINVIAGTDSNSKADVNSDGKTDISDIVAVINIIANPLTEEQTPVFELHKTLNAGMLTPLCLPVDCSTENFDEVFSIMSIDEEGNAWICPTESIPAGTPFVARCNSKREVTPFYDVSVCDKPQQTELPWAGGIVNGDFGSFSWTYTTVLDSVKTPDILTYHECDLTDMTFNVSLENLDVRRYLAQIHYDYSTVSIIEDFTFNTTMRRDIPNPVTILLPENDASELLLSIGTTEGGNDAGVFKPQAGESAYKVYNLIPQRTYYYSLAGDGHQLAKGQFRTTGQLRMIHAPSVSNIRDLGGWPTDDGRHVRYGKLLRGGELNGQHQATPEDVDVLKSLGVAAEIDLRWTRKSSERFKDISAFGFSAEEGNYFFADAEDYAGKQFGETDTQERLKKELQLVINTLKKQKAVYFHCVWGADRTGFLAFLIEGILGLTPDSFFKEFELTSFSDAGIRTKNGFADRPRFFDQFDGETLSERCIHYCTDILGISQQDIDFLKETMLE
jgi:protein-tyrosine phosphatase